MELFVFFGLSVSILVHQRNLVQGQHRLRLCLNNAAFNQLCEGISVDHRLNLKSGPRLDVQKCVDDVVESHSLSLLLELKVGHDPLDPESEIFDSLSQTTRVGRGIVTVQDQRGEVRSVRVVQEDVDQIVPQ